MRLNKDQREGLAKIGDNIATALVLASILGWWVEGRFSVSLALGLTGFAASLIVLSVLLRKEVL